MYTRIRGEGNEKKAIVSHPLTSAKMAKLLGKIVECNGMQYEIVGNTYRFYGLRYDRTTDSIISDNRDAVILKSTNSLQQKIWVSVKSLNTFYTLVEDDG